MDYEAACLDSYKLCLSNEKNRNKNITHYFALREGLMTASEVCKL